MNNLAQTYLNAFSILILGLIIHNTYKKYRGMKKDEKYFILLAFVSIVALATSATLPQLWGSENSNLHSLIKVLQIIDFVFSISVPLFWLCFCIYRIYPKIKFKNFTKYIIPTPLAILTILAILTYRYNLLFLIDANNEYFRGPLFFPGISMGYIYIIAAAVFVVVKRKSLNTQELFLYLLFPILTSLVSLLERLFHFPVYLSWTIGALVLLEIQMHVLNKKSNIDYLTNLNNRMAFDDYIKETISQSISTNKSFGLIVLDIDDFKEVNDKYGHSEGDKALVATSKMLCDSFTGRNFLSRYGGDEFAVVIRDCTHDMMNDYLYKLEKHRDAYNESTNKPYKINFSIGAYVFKEEEITDARNMFMLVDKIMYNNKSAKSKS